MECGLLVFPLYDNKNPGILMILGVCASPLSAVARRAVCETLR